MYKDEGCKYFMGPIWDFDYAFDYEGTRVHFGSYSRPLFRKLTDKSTGHTFFSRFLEDPEVRALYKSTWEKFRTENMPLLIDYINTYASYLTESQKKDFQVWENASKYPGTNNYSYKINQLKNWLEGRAHYIDIYVKGI